MRNARSQRALALALVLLAAVSCSETPPRTAPGVVWIVIDTLRADHLSQYGYPLPTSPGLDRLAAHSTRFEQAFATAPWTTPSVASLLTGLGTARHRANAFGAVLGEDAVSLAERLDDAGWYTAGFSHNLHISAESGFDQGFDVFESVPGRAKDYPDASLLRTRVGQWIAERPAGPFFLFLQPMNVHGPYKVPAEAAATLLGRPPRADFAYLGPYMTGILSQRDLSLRERMPRAQLESLVEQYDTAIRYTTDQVGALLDDLDRAGLYDGSLVVVTSDHGEELFDRGGFGHGYSLHDEVVRVPLFVKLPGQRLGRVVSEAVSLVDLHPTVLSVLGLAGTQELAGTEGLDGRSLAPLLASPGERADAPAPERALLQQTAWESRCVGRALRLGRHRLIEIESSYDEPGPKRLLYDVVADPGESRNLAQERPELARGLHQRLREEFRRGEARALGEPSLAGEHMDRERLRSLGYLDEP